MAAAVFSTNFARSAGFGGSVLFSVASGFTDVLRDVDVYCNAGPAGAAFHLFGGNSQTIIFLTWGPFEQASKQWTGRQVLDDTQTWGFSGSGSLMDVTVSGYHLAN